MKSSRPTYIPALKYRALTRYYDWVVSLTTREQIFKLRWSTKLLR